MSNEMNIGWDNGVTWASKNWYTDSKGRKNVDGGLLGLILSQQPGRQQGGFAEGVRYFLSTGKTS